MIQTNKFEHYPQRSITLLPGDEIRATYRQIPKGAFNPSTLKHLFGWTEGMRYKGCVRQQRKGECVTDGTIVVEFYDIKTGKRQCTHPVYNIELMAVKGELYDFQYTPNPSPSLFENQ